MFVLGAALLLVTAATRPGDFEPPDVDDPETVERASLLEKRFASELTRVRSDEGPWAIRVREDDVNAWLWTRLPAWIANRGGKDSFGAEPVFQVRFLRDRLRLCTDRVAVSTAAGIDDGALVLRPTSGSAIGRLPVPTTFIDLLTRAIDLRGLVDSVRDEAGGPVLSREDGVWRLPDRLSLVDGREVVLLEVRLDEGEVVLVLETVSGTSTGNPPE